MRGCRYGASIEWMPWERGTLPPGRTQMATATLEERVSRLEGGFEHLATKADVAELRGDLHALESRLHALDCGRDPGIGGRSGGRYRGDCGAGWERSSAGDGAPSVN